MEIEERDVYPLVEQLVGEEEAEEATVEHGLARERPPAAPRSSSTSPASVRSCRC